MILHNVSILESLGAKILKPCSSKVLSECSSVCVNVSEPRRQLLQQPVWAPKLCDATIANFSQGLQCLRLLSRFQYSIPTHLWSQVLRGRLVEFQLWGPEEQNRKVAWIYVYVYICTFYSWQGKPWVSITPHPLLKRCRKLLGGHCWQSLKKPSSNYGSLLFLAS